MTFGFIRLAYYCHSDIGKISFHFMVSMRSQTSPEIAAKPVKFKWIVADVRGPKNIPLVFLFSHFPIFLPCCRLLHIIQAGQPNIRKRVMPSVINQRMIYLGALLCSSPFQVFNVLQGHWLDFFFPFYFTLSFGSFYILPVVVLLN